MDRDRVEPQVEDFPGPRARETAADHRAVAAPSTYVYDFVWDHTAPATGPFCTDVDGNVLMDFTGHVGAMPLGYNNPDLLDRLEAFDLVDPLKIAGQDFYLRAGTADTPEIPGPTELMDRLVEVSGQYGMDTVFLSNTGAEAVENAIKIAYDGADGRAAITTEGGFHGRTLGTLSLNRSKGVYRRGFPEIAGVHDIPFCNDRSCEPGTCECGFFAGGTSALDRLLGATDGALDPSEVAYLILEPVQGEGGYRIPSDAFAEEISRLCEDHDITLVVDEVQSGVGRTGEWWASDHFAFDPDVIASAKALRVGATIGAESTFPEERRRLSSTWGAGDVLGSAVGALTIDVIRSEGLLDNATERGAQAVEELEAATLPGAVDVRGLGLMLAVEWETADRRDELLEACLAEGLLTMGCGTKTTRVLPPLDVTEREIDLGVSLLERAATASA